MRSPSTTKNASTRTISIVRRGPAAALRMAQRPRRLAANVARYGRTPATVLRNTMIAASRTAASYAAVAPGPALSGGRGLSRSQRREHSQPGQQYSRARAPTVAMPTSPPRSRLQSRLSAAVRFVPFDASDRSVAVAKSRGAPQCVTPSSPLVAGPRWSIMLGCGYGAARRRRGWGPVAQRRFEVAARAHRRRCRGSSRLGCARDRHRARRLASGTSRALEAAAGNATSSSTSAPRARRQRSAQKQGGDIGDIQRWLDTRAGEWLAELSGPS